MAAQFAPEAEATNIKTHNINNAVSTQVSQ